MPGGNGFAGAAVEFDRVGVPPARICVKTPVSVQWENKFFA